MKKRKKDDKVFSILVAIWAIAVAVSVVKLLIGYNGTDAKLDVVENNQEQKIVELEKKYNNDQNLSEELRSYLPSLVELCKNDKDAIPILERLEEYPPRLIKVVVSNHETVNFVSEYFEKKDIDVKDIDVSNECEPNEVPLFIQWDSRWGYVEYAGGLAGYTACGPTCLSMVDTYFKGKCLYTPKDMVQFSIDNNYVEEGVGTKWALMEEGARKLGLTSKKIDVKNPDEKERLVKDAISNGKVLICKASKGYFTESGHFIVITDYLNGYVTINDPNSRSRSDRKWEFKDIASQLPILWAIGNN